MQGNYRKLASPRISPEKDTDKTVKDEDKSATEKDTSPATEKAKSPATEKAKSPATEKDKSVRKKSPFRNLLSTSPESVENVKKSLFTDSGKRSDLGVSGSEISATQYIDLPTVTPADGMNEYFDLYNPDLIESAAGLNISEETKVIEKPEQFEENIVTPNSFDTVISPRKSPVKRTLYSRVMKEIEKLRKSFQKLIKDLQAKEQTKFGKFSEKSFVWNYNNYKEFHLDIPTLRFTDRPKARKFKKRIIKEFREFEKQGGDVVEELFPYASFPEEERENFLNSRLVIPPDFLERFIAFPDEVSLSDVLEHIPIIIDRMTKPVKFEFIPDAILKSGGTFMRRGILNIFRPLYLVLLKNGLLLIYKSRNIYTDSPLFSYYLKKCEVKNIDSLDLTVKVYDDVSRIKIELKFKENIIRNEWANTFRLVGEALKTITWEEEREIDFEFLNTEPVLSPQKVEEFIIVKVLGRGTFGKVVLARNPRKNRYYTMKLMRKDILLEDCLVSSVIFENYLLRLYKHPFLQKLKYSFVTDTLVVFAMELANGGSLAHHVFRERVFSPKIAVYYGVQMATAIIYLHTKSVILRDVNLYSTYLDHEGNLKLTDFGLCIGNADKKCYNPGRRQNTYYVAPELLLGEPYAFSCDWWSFGVCFYSLLTGEQLFGGGSELDIWSKIVHGKMSFKNQRPFMRDFLEKILERNPTKRLGCQRNEKEILNHKIFIELLWKKSNGLEIKPPIKPNVNDDKDTSLLDLDDYKLYDDVQLTPPRERKLYMLPKGRTLDHFHEFIPCETSSSASSTN